ncbi:hypothetical protein GCM10018965_079400 [Nonomuraea roseola]
MPAPALAFAGMRNSSSSAAGSAGATWAQTTLVLPTGAFLTVTFTPEAVLPWASVAEFVKV